MASSRNGIAEGIIMIKKQSYIALSVLLFLSGFALDTIIPMIIALIIWAVMYYSWKSSVLPKLEIGHVSNPSKRHSNFIYVWKDKEDERYYKIGRTNNPYKRLKTFQTAQPKPIEVVAVVAVKNDEKAEKFIHEKFANIRVRGNGEWFYATRGLKRYVSKIKDASLTKSISEKI